MKRVTLMIPNDRNLTQAGIVVEIRKSIDTYKYHLAAQTPDMFDSIQISVQDQNEYMQMVRENYKRIALTEKGNYKGYFIVAHVVSSTLQVYDRNGVTYLTQFLDFQSAKRFIDMREQTEQERASLQTDAGVMRYLEKHRRSTRN